MSNSKKISIKRILAVLLGLLLSLIAFFAFANFSPVPVKSDWGSGPAAVDYVPLLAGAFFLLTALSFFLYTYFSGQETESSERMQSAFGCFGTLGLLVFFGALVVLILVLKNLNPG